MNWRLLVDPPATGSWNMAVDEALLRSHAAGHSPPTLRFYSWAPWCLSLGRLQRFEPAAQTELAMVRRPTGGRAVWHQHEVTYAAVVRQELLPRESWSVLGAYQWLSRGFLPGLEQLGAAVQLAAVVPGEGQPGKSRPGAAANCFTVSTGDCDFTVDGKKLIGAAQCRREDTILQHGSLLLAIDGAAWTKALGETMSNAVSLADLGIEASAPQIVAALAAGFARRHDLELLPGTLSESELALARSLQLEKYGTDDWTRRGIAGDVCTRKAGEV